MAEELAKFGIQMDVMENEIVVHKGTLTKPSEAISSHNDHRIAMAAAVAACICEEPVVIHGAEAVRKSYPTFFTEFAKRGMSVCPPYVEKI